MVYFTVPDYNMAQNLGGCPYLIHREPEATRFILILMHIQYVPLKVLQV